MVLGACLRFFVIGACLCLPAAVNFPVGNDKSRWREKGFYSMWPESPLLDSSMPDKTRITDLSFHNIDLALGGFEGFRDVLYPIPVEREYLVNPTAMLARNLWWLGATAATLYLLAVWQGQAYMASRPAFNLKGLLAAWNLLLAIFSTIGMMRVVPQLVLMIYTYGFDYSICRAAINSYGNGASGFWIVLFIFSKYVELIDTVFLVLRKKPVTFLHWYHHSTVLLYCWHSFVYAMPTGIHFAAMNYSVHAIMYSYYFLAAVLKKPPRWGTFVTILQLAQMVGGIAVTLRHLHSLLGEPIPNCDGYVPNLVGALTMYASYFLLFAQFFFKRYCMKRDHGKDNKDTKRE